MSLDETVTYVSGPYRMPSTFAVQRTGGDRAARRAAYYLAEAVIPRCAAPRWTAAIIVPVTRALARDSLCYNLVRT
jgi:hypothetical protein